MRLGARDGIGDSRGMTSRASPPADMLALSGSRTKAVRLARLNPGVMQRFEEVSHRSPWASEGNRAHRGSHRSSSTGPVTGISRVQSDSAGLDFSMPADKCRGGSDYPVSWSLSLPPVRGAAARQAGDVVLPPFGRDLLLPDTRKDVLEEEEHAPKSSSRSTSDRSGRHAEVRDAEAACKARFSSMEARIANLEARLATEESKRAAAEEELQTSAQLADQKLKAAKSRLLALGMSQADSTVRSWEFAVFNSWRLLSREARFQVRLNEEADRCNAAEAASRKAEEERLRLARRIDEVEARAVEDLQQAQLVLEHQLQEAEVTWQGKLDSQRLELARQQEQALQQQAQEAEARFQEEVTRSNTFRTHTAKLREQLEHERARHEQATRISPSATSATTLSCLQEARRRSFAAGSLWASTTERAILLPVFAVWHVAVRHRQVAGALQTKLFEEEACRGAALHAQKMEFDARFAEAEVKHRSALHCLRAELMEAEARCADALQAQEAQQRLANATSEVALSPRTEAGDEDMENTWGDPGATL